MEFQAVVLAGGRGDQMIDLTSSIPKPLLPVGNRPLIWYTLNSLHRVGFRDVIIVTLNSISTQVKQIASSFNMNADVVGISEDSQWGTIDSLVHIKDKIKADVLLVSCDLLHDFELHRLADVHRINDSSVTMLLAKSRPELESLPGVKSKRKRKKPKEIVGLGKQNCDVSKVVFLENEADLEDDHVTFRHSLMIRQPNIHVRTDLVDVHLYIIKRWLIDFFACNSNKSMSSFRGDMLPYLVKKQWKKRKDLTDVSNGGGDSTIARPAEDLFSYFRQQSEIMKIMDMSLKTKPVPNSCGTENNPLSVYALVNENGFCMRVNTLSSFVEANRLMSRSVSLVAPNLADVPLVHASVKIEERTQIGADSMVAEDTCIGTKVSVKRTIIGKRCTVGNNVKLANCIILDNVAVKDGCTANNSVICDGVEFGEKCSLKDCLIGSQRILQPGTIISCESMVESAAMMDFE